jgi:signal transduction histidine kinase
MAATVAHQAGTPLNLISGYVQMLLEDSRVDERTRTRLRTIDAQIANVTRVLRTMLDRARHAPQSEPVRVADVIEHVREVSAPRLARTNIRLVVDVEASIPPVNAHAAQLEMALLNLVTNALDAMPNGGVLTISASNGSDSVRIEVADTGPGIPGAIADHLFDPWVTTKPAGQGTGLGLAIVRDVVHAHNGRVSVRSEPQGAVFVIDLPAHAPHPTAA